MLKLTHPCQNKIFIAKRNLWNIIDRKITQNKMF